MFNCNYRVILTANGEYRKTLKRCQKVETAFKYFNKLIDENVVYFPKRFINHDEIRPVKYKIYVVKNTTSENDEFRIIRDELGRIIKEPPLFGIWTVLADHDYEIEETFYLYNCKGSPKKKENRITIKDIMKILLKDINKKNNIKEVIVYNNKLIIYNETQFDMVICKNVEDAQRLHHSLYKACEKNKKMDKIIFMGTAKEMGVRNMIFDLIKKNTGWNEVKIKRYSTRP